MQPITEDLNIQAVTMHLDPNYNEDSIQTIVLDMLKNIKQRFEINSPFYLLGYSFGVDIALELAALLEKEGLTGVIYCLNSSPEQIKSQIYSYIEQLDIDELQVFILSYLYNQTSGKEANGLRDELQALNDWSERVDMLIKKLSGLSSCSLQYVRLLAEAAYGRIKLAAEYEPNLKLKSKLVLIKGTTKDTMKLEEDYGLSANSLKEIQVYHIKNDHANAPYDCSVPYIINKELEPELLNKKKMQNLCDGYFKNHKI